VLTDVCPYTLGIAVSDSPAATSARYFAPIIERNSIVPVSRMDRFSTIQDNQKLLQVEIYQGESQYVSENIFLASLNVPVPQNKAGHEAISVRFSYDVNGLLEVDVVVDSTGQQHRQTIENRPGTLSPDELGKSRKRLASLKFHPRESEINKAVLARGDRLYQSLLGADRERVASAMRQFEAILDGQRVPEINRMRDELIQFLDDHDPDARA